MLRGGSSICDDRRVSAADDAGRRLDELLETVEARLDRLEASVEDTPEPESTPTLEEPEPEPEPPQSHVLLVPAPSGYTLVARGGRLPERGETIELPERELRYAVVKIVRAPIPDDRRPWVYLEAAS
jgi:hypothetical protein